MSRKAFVTAADASTVTFDIDQSKNWQVTLGGNRTLVIAGGQDGDEITLLLIQDSTGSRTVSWPTNVSFAAGQAPNLTTTAAGSDLITLVKKGSTWRDKGGAPSRLPARITSGILGTIVGAGAVALTLVVSGGNGQRPGIAGLPAAQEWKTGTGAAQVTVARVTASGALVVGQSGALVVGSPILSATGAQARFYVYKDGTTTIRSTASGYTLKGGGGVVTADGTGLDANGSISGRTLYTNGAPANAGLCKKSNGAIGYCSDAVGGGGTCTCN